MSTYQFCVRALFAEAMLFVATGLVIGLVWKTWQVVVAGPLVLLACEITGYGIEQCTIAAT
jgi:hypothetical protein